jgi:hypothetical protein
MLTDNERKVDVELSLDVLKTVMVVLKDKGICRFSDIPRTQYDENYLKKKKELEESFDHHARPAELMPDVRRNLEVMLSLSEYDEADARAILAAYDNKVDRFEIDAVKDYEVIDNRLYIAIGQYEMDDMFTTCLSDRTPDYNTVKYFVVSKNPYDYYFCSYGSSIQSCFSLTSSHTGYHGAIPLSVSKGHFITYFTGDKPNKSSLVPGEKWYVPRMNARAWAWLSEDNKLIPDRIYSGAEFLNGSQENAYKYVFSKYFDVDYDELKTSVQIELKYAEELFSIFAKDYRTYPDSVSFWKEDGYTSFKYRGICNGNREFVGYRTPQQSMYDKLQRITNGVPSDFHYSPYAKIVNGSLNVFKRCPVTGLLITQDEEQSKYAKFFDKPVSRLLVGTYIDGFFKADDFYDLDQLTEDIGVYYQPGTDVSSTFNCTGSIKFTQVFSYKPVKMVVFKERLKGLMKNCTDIDCVLMRYIDDDNKVSYVKYYKKG